MRKTPYGIADFELIRNEDYYFVDKTRYIQNIEDNANFLFFFRPRRFGKSLLCSLLECYYDIKRADKFETLFGGLWIGETPTPERNKYLVLRFDFSQIKKEIDLVEQSFCEYTVGVMEIFLMHYAEYFNAEETEFIKRASTPGEMMRRISAVVKNWDNRLPIYLIIDEYDNFTNAILFAKSNRTDYEKITHGTGFYRDFFQACKPSFDRIFMTGVSPVTYDDLTSGFNIGMNITMFPEFNGMLGFTEEEVRSMVDYYRENGIIGVSTEDIISVIRPWYDNCCFAENRYGRESVYNSDAVLFFMNQYKARGGMPRDMIDPNTRTDYTKLKMLVLSGSDVERQVRMEILEQIVTEEAIVSEVIGMFPAERLGDQDSFISMLFYYGVLTFGGYNDYGLNILRITNKVMRTQYLEYMMAMVAEAGVSLKRQILDMQLREMAISGEWKGLVDYIGEVYHEATTVRCSQTAERYAQAFFQGMIYLNPYYCVKPEVEARHGFCDLFLFPEPTARIKARYTYIIELKYKRSGDNSRAVEALAVDAERQLRQYAADKGIAAMANGLPMKLIYIVVDEGRILMAEEVDAE